MSEFVLTEAEIWFSREKTFHWSCSSSYWQFGQHINLFLHKEVIGSRTLSKGWFSSYFRSSLHQSCWKSEFWMTLVMIYAVLLHLDFVGNVQLKICYNYIHLRRHCFRDRDRSFASDDFYSIWSHCDKCFWSEGSATQKVKHLRMSIEIHRI